METFGQEIFYRSKIHETRFQNDLEYFSRVLISAIVIFGVFKIGFRII
jgi:hypothetical protein